MLEHPGQTLVKIYYTECISVVYSMQCIECTLYNEELSHCTLYTGENTDVKKYQMLISIYGNISQRIECKNKC